MLGALVALLAVGTASAATVTPVMTGLDNPRGLDFGPDGALYVTEGGRGGPGPPFRFARGELQGYGATGAISRLRNGVQERWLTGLPSLAPPSGLGAEGGPQDIAFQFDTIPFFGRGDAYVTIGLSADPAARAPLGAAGTLMGKLLKISPSRQITEIADLASFEAAANPDGAPSFSNPYGLLSLSRFQIVVDAGANDVLRVAGGHISPLNVLSARANPTPIGPPSIDSVPTSVAVGPDGALYVSELTGMPFLTGFARIHRIGPDGVSSVFATGLTAVVDLAFADDGRLYALQHASCGPFFACPGSLVRVNASAPHPVVQGGLTRPGAMTIGSDGAFYVSHMSSSPGTGEVLRIAP
jgi:hypothetical protein